MASQYPCGKSTDAPVGVDASSGHDGAFSRDEAFLIAVNIAKLPSVPRQILNDIPRPPNLVRRDD
jgi:hypothetical protein